MGFISKFTKLRRNREFDYQPRYYKSDKEGNPFKIEYKFDQFRTTAGSNRGLKAKFNNVVADAKKQGDRNMRVRMLIIISILVLIFLYIIDFDLSIFFSS
ncbi:riboflavin synthase subunit beta [Maribacter sp. 2308TA10-17]|uniref:riboflavin synthase subunit beta n=1 Tax=Maribacter sp. 2308TA10-17 TaxID=3386276 RepID=UPI0039BD1E57